MKQVLVLFPFLLLLSSCRTASDDRRMAQIIAEADSMNRNFVPMTSDSLLQEACRYYDRHGTPNQRMQAHYLLGCVYRDRGEAPEALEAYHTAADCADTTASDCDYRRLSRVHGQMATLLCDQLLPYEALEELAITYLYAQKGNDTLAWLCAYEFQNNAYNLLHQYDKSISILETAYHEFKKYGYNDQASLCLRNLIYFQTEQGYLSEAKKNIDLFETTSGFFQNGNIERGRELYYYYKALYYTKIEKLDSAEHLIRKLLVLEKEDGNSKEAAYKGLSLIYTKRGINDSIAKYASLCYQTSEENYTLNLTDELRRTQALYNYNIHRQAAIQKEKEAAQAKQTVIIVSAVGIIFILLLISFILNLIRKRKQEVAMLTQEFENRMEQLRTATQEMEISTVERFKDRSLERMEENRRKLCSLLGIDYHPDAVPVNLRDNDVYQSLAFALSHPQVKPGEADWKRLHALFNEKIPEFQEKLTHGKTISEKDLLLCMLIRMGFGVSETAILMDSYPQYISVRRCRLLKKLFQIEGKADDFDKIVMMIQ